MKKFLLGLGAIAALSGALHSVSAQQAPTLTISGSTSFKAFGFSNNHKVVSGYTPSGISSARDGAGTGYLFTQGGDMAFTVSGVMANGIDYNYVISLGLATNGVSVVENRIELKGGYGTVRIGSMISPIDMLMVSASSVLGATGGFDGDYTKVFRRTIGTISGDSLTIDPGTATKVTYYTPRYAGFMLGLSFTPISNANGAADINDNQNNDAFINRGISSATLNFSHEFNNGVNLSSTIALAHANQTKSGSRAPVPALYNPRAMRGWMWGLLLTYRNWDLGGAYMDNLKSGTFNNDVGYDGGNSWSAALGYTFDQGTKLAVGFQSAKKKNGNFVAGSIGKTDIVSLTADHPLAPGFTVYGEYDYLNFRIPNGRLTATTPTGSATLQQRSTFVGGGTVPSNKGNAFILGAKVAF